MVRKAGYILLLLLIISGCNKDNELGEPIQEAVIRTKSTDKGVGTLAIPEPARDRFSTTQPREKKKDGKKKVKKVIVTKPNPFNQIQTRLMFPFDSIKLMKLRQLHDQDLELDLSEPQNQAYLLLPYDSLKKATFITLNREVLLKINFDNDILNNTDRFYTNGIRIEIISPTLRAFPLNFLMLPYRGSGMNYYGLMIVQNMYTPSTTKIGGILYGDRPYAAYLFLGNYKISNDPEKRFRQTSELDLGVIGPYSFGGFVQKSFHATVPTNNEPLGWLYQVQNDLVLNYNLCFEKGFVSSRSFELNVYGAPVLGTLYTNVGGGIRLRGGLLNPYFTNLGISKARFNRKMGLRNTQLFMSLYLEGRAVGYDATLQGGLFNQSSVYKISSQGISRFVFEGNVGITFTHGGFMFEIGQYLLSPEFHNGWWHHWVHTGLTFSL
jgi:lipid A 3-O-deacylase